VNPIRSVRRGRLLTCLIIAATSVGFSSFASEYEVDGQVSQTLMRQNGTNLSATASFTVYVRDSGWLIKTIETNEIGGIASREVGSTNGTEIYECEGRPGSSGTIFAVIISNNVPVGELDSAVVGHLWLMFASQCYWPSLNSDQLTPIYDWRASVAAASTGFGNQGKVSAEWNLLNGPGSLPQEVVYFGWLDETNGFYKITGTNSVGGTLIPTGFIFEEHQNKKLDKRVEVTVTAIRPVCSRDNLIPLPDDQATIVDRRFDSGVPNRPPSYQNPVIGQWPTVEESRKLAGVQKDRDLSALARMGVSPFPKKSEPEAVNPSPPVLSLAIRCTNEVVKAGDEISIEFHITNRGTNDYKYADRTYDRSGRMNEYKLVARNESGETFPDPRANDKGGWFGGGLFQYAILKPGQSFTKTIPLNRWALVKEPGRYTVVATNFVDSHSTNVISVTSDPITVTVLPRTAQEMDTYIAGLTNQLDAKITGRPNGKEPRPPDQSLNELVVKLMFTCSPKIIPSLLKSIYESGDGGFWESEAIRFYVPHTPETKQKLIEAAIEHGFGPNGTISYLLEDYGCTKEEMKPLIERALAPDNQQDWVAGAGLAQQFSDDDFTARLIAIATTPRINAQTAAIEALAYNRTDEGVKTLKSLLNDPHEKIWTPLAFAIENAYNYRHDSTGKPLRPDDFTAKDFKPLIERMLASGQQNADSIVGIRLIEQFGGDDFTTQLIAIATSPGNIARDTAIYALALNRTDEGVQTLKTLLNDPDPKISKMTEDAIRNAYTTRGNARGRPLRPEDFDAKFRAPK